MHKTITVVAICLLILLTFPRVMSEEMKEIKQEETQLKDDRNITVIITEIKPMASELIANLTTNITEAEKTESDVKEKETNIVEIAVTTPKTAETKINLDQIKQEIKLAQEDLAAKQERLKELEKKANSAQELSQKAQDHLKALINVLNGLQGSLIQSNKAAFETDWQLQLQTAMYNEAKRKYAKLTRELEMTKGDYEKTKSAAENAMMSAKIAQKNSDDMAAKLANLAINNNNFARKI
ncbi:Protein of unknown function (DUF745) [Popillia japonica]|uniref:Uncharacterized protein n=1 Tax=Popillia japonica TaxID=7064 RepID=A0AAW1KJK4_POPJA